MSEYLIKAIILILLLNLAALLWFAFNGVRFRERRSKLRGDRRSTVQRTPGPAPHPMRRHTDQLQNLRQIS